MNSYKYLLQLSILLLFSCSPSKFDSEKQEENLLSSDTSLRVLLETKIESPNTSNYVNTPCGWDTSRCTLPKDHEAHFNPYYNGHLCENFSPQQIDFSKEYLDLREKRTKSLAIDITEQVRIYNYDLDSLFNSGDFQNDGVIGPNYRRIKVHIDKTEMLKPNHFKIIGQTNVNGNVCRFEGRMKIHKIYEFKENYDFPGQSTLFATYEFREDDKQKDVGIFKGSFECSVFVDHERQTIKLDNSFDSADGYHNRTYVGIWTPYNSENSKKCIWGDYRLPFTFDFDQGDGEMMVNKKYIDNGWQSYMDGADYEFKNGKRQLKNKWWE